MFSHYTDDYVYTLYIRNFCYLWYMEKVQKSRLKKLTEKITLRHLEFCEEYLACWNASEAGRRLGYSVKHARGIASRILQSDDLQEYIAIRRGKIPYRHGERETELHYDAKGSIIFTEMADFMYIDMKGGIHLRGGLDYATLPFEIVDQIDYVRNNPRGLSLFFLDHSLAKMLL